MVDHAPGSVNDDVFPEKAVVFYGSSVEQSTPERVEIQMKPFLSSRMEIRAGCLSFLGGEVL